MDKPSIVRCFAGFRSTTACMSCNHSLSKNKQLNMLILPIYNFFRKLILFSHGTVLHSHRAAKALSIARPGTQCHSSSERVFRSSCRLNYVAFINLIVLILVNAWKNYPRFLSPDPFSVRLSTASMPLDTLGMIFLTHLLEWASRSFFSF
jgi:hypothetical protein